jgi:hypothetical protein
MPIRKGAKLREIAKSTKEKRHSILYSPRKPRNTRCRPLPSSPTSRKERLFTPPAIKRDRLQKEYPTS